MGRKIDIDKLNFVADRLTKARNSLEKIQGDARELARYLRETEKSFNMSKGALKSWQEWFYTTHEKKMKALIDENTKLTEELDKIRGG